jgi:hypothetical protein
MGTTCGDERGREGTSATRLGVVLARATGGSLPAGGGLVRASLSVYALGEQAASSLPRVDLLERVQSSPHSKLP